MKRCFSLLLLAATLITILAGCSCQHQWTDADCESPKTCAKCGETTGSALGHIYGQATCTEAAKCSVCHQNRGEPLGHKFSAPSCTDPVKCMVCNFVSSEPTGHDFSKAPCDADTKCAVCGAANTKPLAHNYGNATCEKPSQCNYCGLTKGDALGHNWKNNVCTQCKVTRPDALSSVNYGIGIDKNQPELKIQIDTILETKVAEIDAIKEKYMNGEDDKYVGVTSGTKDGAKAANQLVIATNAEFAPWEYKEGNQFFGIDMEIAKLIADELGLELVIDDMEFDAVVAAVGKQNVDIAISGITITEEQKSNILFSSPYYTGDR